jgi:anti-anti-sigma factor
LKGIFVSGTPSVPYFSIEKGAPPESLQALRIAVVRAVEDGAKSVAIDIDEVGLLDSRLIAALISILREAREHGASVLLGATRKNILDTLRITALDKVFTIVTSPQAVPIPAPLATRTRRKVLKSGRAMAAFTGILFAATVVFGARASAQTEPSADDVIRSVVGQNAQMQSYQARVSVDLALRTFPYLAQHLEGTTYFERPDNYEIVFDSVPSYAKGFDKVYTDIGEPSSWPRRFKISLLGENTVAGHRDLLLRMVQRVRGMIDHEDVAVDRTAWHVDQMEWHYYNGGVIRMTQEFANVDGFSVLVKQHATIRIPFVHAGAEAVYHNYQANVAIDASVFTRERH